MTILIPTITEGATCEYLYDGRVIEFVGKR
jgi:hypothetical protein